MHLNQGIVNVENSVIINKCVGTNLEPISCISSTLETCLGLQSDNKLTQKLEKPKLNLSDVEVGCGLWIGRPILHPVFKLSVGY